MLKMLTPGRCLSPGEVAALEGRLRLQLPADYRQFLANNNGGISVRYQTKYFHRFYEEKQTLIIFDWLPVIAEEKGRLTVEVAMSNLRRLRPDGMIPIARGDGGEPVLLALNENNYGIVYLLDTEVPDQRSLSMVAKSFGEFVGSLELDT